MVLGSGLTENIERMGWIQDAFRRKIIMAALKWRAREKALSFKIYITQKWVDSAVIY